MLPAPPRPLHQLRRDKLQAYLDLVSNLMTTAGKCHELRTKFRDKFHGPQSQQPSNQPHEAEIAATLLYSQQLRHLADTHIALAFEALNQAAAAAAQQQRQKQAVALRQPRQVVAQHTTPTATAAPEKKKKKKPPSPARSRQLVVATAANTAELRKAVREERRARAERFSKLHQVLHAKMQKVTPLARALLDKVGMTAEVEAIMDQVCLMVLHRLQREIIEQDNFDTHLVILRRISPEHFSQLLLCAWSTIVATRRCEAQVIHFHVVFVTDHGQRLVDARCMKAPADALVAEEIPALLGKSEPVLQLLQQAKVLDRKSLAAFAAKHTELLNEGREQWYLPPYRHKMHEVVGQGEVLHVFLGPSGTTGKALHWLLQSQ